MNRNRLNRDPHPMATSMALGLALLALSLPSLGCGGGDPPGDGTLVLGVRSVLPPEPFPPLSGGTGETLAGLEGMQVTTRRVDVVHRRLRDDPTTERVITVDDVEREFTFLGELTDLSPRLLGSLPLQPGFAFPIRLVPHRMTTNIT